MHDFIHGSIELTRQHLVVWRSTKNTQNRHTSTHHKHLLGTSIYHMYFESEPSTCYYNFQIILLPHFAITQDASFQRPFSTRKLLVFIEGKTPYNIIVLYLCVSLWINRFKLCYTFSFSFLSSKIFMCHWWRFWLVPQSYFLINSVASMCNFAKVGDFGGHMHCIIAELFYSLLLTSHTELNSAKFFSFLLELEFCFPEVQKIFQSEEQVL